MLSASTLSSNASDAFSTNTSATTPVSPYSLGSTPKLPGSNPLTELIETEKSYMETLKIIDIQLAPLWSGQPSDFGELLANVREIIKVNKRFCAKLVKIAANPQTIKELGDILMQWVEDMEVPYANFSRAHIPNLNQRRDIASHPAIQRLLKDLSTSAACEISLESLFNAPVQQLKYYKMLYSRLLESAEPGRADHKLLVKANRRIDTVMLMAQKSAGKPLAADPASSSSPPLSSRAHTKPLPIVTPIQTDMTSVRSEFVRFDDLQLDCAQVVDLFTGAPMPHFAPRLPADASIVLRDRFIQLPGEANQPPIRVQLILTNEILLVVKDGADSVYILLYPPLAVNDITVKCASLDRELVGEYIVQLTVGNSKSLTMRADNKETRNKWVGAADHAPSSTMLTPRPLRSVLPDKGPRKSVVRKNDFFSFYTDQTGEISPLSSDESDSEDLPLKAPAESKSLPAPPPPPKAADADLRPPLAPKLDGRLSPRSASPAPSAASSSTFNSSPEDSPGASARPVSPRTIEISHAVAPMAAMQAVTQSNDYLADVKPLPRTSSQNTGPPVQMPGRSSSFTRHPPAQKALPQQPPPPPAHHVRSPSPMNRPPQQHRPPMLQQHQGQPLNPRPSLSSGLPGNRSPSPAGYPQQQQQQQQQGAYLNPSPHLHPARSIDDLSSPPRSPTPHMINGQPNGIRQVIYSGQCEVFHWKSESWYAVDGQCMLEVRQTFTNRSCVAILMRSTGHLYLNAWVLPNTVICHASPTDVSISVFMGNLKENYLVHFQTPAEAGHLYQVLARVHQESSRMGNMGEGALRTPPLAVEEDHKDDEPPQETQQPQTLRLVMQCKTKLFVQNEHSNWSSFGSVTMKISQQLPSKKMHVEMENGKGQKATKLVSATVQSRNVSRINPKRITFLLVNEKERQSMVYMIQIKEEQTGQKIYEYLKTKNAENGW